jgi:hypothetical protein
MSYMPRDLDDYFAPIGGVIGDFAQQHGLLLEKYYHESPTWSLCFGHPKGGQAKVDVSADSEQHVVVQGIWWLDDYASFTRSLLWGEKHGIARQPAAIADALEQSFRDVLRWELGNWNQVATGYRPYWEAFTPDAFVRFSNPWPEPNGEGHD